MGSGVRSGSGRGGWRDPIIAAFITTAALVIAAGVLKTVGLWAGFASGAFLALLGAVYWKRNVVGALARVAEPYWWPTLLIAALSYVILVNDQARDWLEAAALEPDGGGGPAAALRLAPHPHVGLTNTLAWLFVATAYFGFTAWTFLRFASELDHRRDGPDPGWWRNILRLQAARVAGVALPLVLAGRYFALGAMKGRGLFDNAYATESLLFFLLAAALFVFFWLRRVVVDRERFYKALVGVEPVITSASEGVISVRSARAWLAVLMAVHLVLLVLFTVGSRFDAPSWFGAPAIVVFAWAGFLGVGWLLFSYLPYRTGWPAVSLFFFGWVALTSVWNDNHTIRTLNSSATPLTQTGAELPPRPPVKATAYARAWLRDRASLIAQCDSWPIFVVAAEGGGVRAAYWTGTVLGRIERETRSLAGGCGSFADHVFMISGVSGGAVGASAFAAAIKDGWDDGADRHRNPERAAAAFFSNDYLSPAVAAMFYPDALARFWPLRGDYVGFADRARWMEGAWEQRWSEVIRGQTTEALKGSFASDYRDLWAKGRIAEALALAGGEPDLTSDKGEEAGMRSPVPPVLAINTTSVSTGQKWVLGPVRFEGAAGQADLGLCESGQFEDLRPKSASSISLATAAHLSARFMYISPAARVDTSKVCPPTSAATSRPVVEGRPGEPPTRFMRFVDGGYFEDSGSDTASEAVDALTRVLVNMRRRCGRGRADGNTGASAGPNPSADTRSVYCRVVVIPLAITTEPETPVDHPPLFAPELRSPPTAVLAARAARGAADLRRFSVSGDVLDGNGRVAPRDAADPRIGSGPGSATGSGAGVSRASPTALAVSATQDQVFARIADEDPSLFIEIRLPRRWVVCPSSASEDGRRLARDQYDTPVGSCSGVAPDAPERLLPLGWTLSQWAVDRMDAAREKQFDPQGCGEAAVRLVGGMSARDVLWSGETSRARCEGIHWN
jgi:hypothetical protein